MLVPLLLSEAGLGRPASVVAKLVDGSFVLGSRPLYMWPKGHQKKADRRAGPHLISVTVRAIDPHSHVREPDACARG